MAICGITKLFVGELVETGAFATMPPRPGSSKHAAYALQGSMVSTNQWHQSKIG